MILYLLHWLESIQQ